MGGVRRGYLSTPLTWNRLTQTFDFSGPAGVAAGDALIQSIFKMFEMCEILPQGRKNISMKGLFIWLLNTLARYFVL